jgi:hypothetical protein
MRYRYLIINIICCALSFHDLLMLLILLILLILYINQINYILNFFHYINYIMNFKTKALFLFGILLFGIIISYFLGGTLMEGFDTPAVTSTTPSTAVTSTTPTTAVTTAMPTTSVATAMPTVNTPVITSTTQTPSNNKYDNYNHYNDLTSTKYYGSTGTPINPLKYDDKEVNPMPHSSANQGISKDYGTQYYSTLPPGIPASQIMPGDEHLYILKSEIVPPVCPACPAFPSASVVNNPPPCPPCGRCPESPFECKKVPNYNAVNSETMPVPVLNDFSSFGM